MLERKWRGSAQQGDGILTQDAMAGTFRDLTFEYGSVLADHGFKHDLTFPPACASLRRITLQLFDPHPKRDSDSHPKSTFA
jgi:hypothetical protein